MRAGSRYKYDPCLMDKCNPPYGASHGALNAGDTVKVVNLHGCPPANTMGHCHIEHPDTGEFLGLVSTASLTRNTD